MFIIQGYIMMNNRLFIFTLTTRKDLMPLTIEQFGAPEPILCSSEVYELSYQPKLVRKSLEFMLKIACIANL